MDGTEPLTMFTGEFRHTIDQKNRLALPSAFRVSARGTPIQSWKIASAKALHEEALYLYPRATWDEIVREKFSKISMGSDEGQFFMREFVATSKDAETDAQGRIVIPADLKEKAGLDASVLVRGALPRIEIWDPTKYDEWVERNRPPVEKVREVMRNIGL